MCSFHCDRAIVCVYCGTRLCRVLGDECLTLGAYRVGNNARIVACAECYQKEGVADAKKLEGVAN